TRCGRRFFVIGPGNQMTRNRFFALILILAVVPCFAGGQIQNNNSEANDALRRKAFDLLESLASQISTLQSAENRARIGSNIADSLWEHDEQRARSLLVSVQDDINAGLQVQPGDRNVDPQRRMVFLQLRINTVERIA